MRGVVEKLSAFVEKLVDSNGRQMVRCYAAHHSDLGGYFKGKRAFEYVATFKWVEENIGSKSDLENAIERKLAVLLKGKRYISRGATIMLSLEKAKSIPSPDVQPLYDVMKYPSMKSENEVLEELEGLEARIKEIEKEMNTFDPQRTMFGPASFETNKHYESELASLRARLKEINDKLVEVWKRTR